MSAVTAANAADSVAIVCPPWCVHSEAFHRDELRTEVGVIHQSVDYGLAPDNDYALTRLDHPDGTPQLEDPSHADVMVITGNGSLMHPDDLEKHAHALLRMVQVARESVAVVS